MHHITIALGEQVHNVNTTSGNVLVFDNIAIVFDISDKKIWPSLDTYKSYKRHLQ